MAVLITGGTGYIGAKLARRLADRGEEVVCFDLHPDMETAAALGERVRVVQGDVTRLGDLISTMKSHPVDRVVHLAYIKTTQAEPIPHVATRVNITGTDYVYEAARLMGVRRVIISSSIGANGLQSSYGEMPVNEEDALFPVSGYGAMKGFNEFMGRRYAALYGLEFVALRIAFAYGHGRKGGLTTWPQDCASLPAIGRAVHLPCTADQMYCLVYDEDVADALFRLCVAERLQHQLYFTGGQTASVGEMAETVRRYIPEADITFADKPEYQAHQYIYRVDASRIREDLGFVARPLAEGILAQVNAARASVGLPLVAK